MHSLGYVPFFDVVWGSGRTVRRMDRYDALRLVIWEYLLPAQRRARAAQLTRTLVACRDALICAPERHPAGVFEVLHFMSDRLLHSHGFATSYTYPVTMQHNHLEIHRRRIVYALVDSDGPFVWNPNCARKADPFGGIRVHRAGAYMSAGRFP